MHAQDTLHNYKTVAVDQAVTLSADNSGNIYVADKQGNIYSYDSLGNHLLTYSPPEVAEVSLLDARATVRIFAFYRELQSYALLNRFLTPIEIYRFQLPDGGFVRVAAQAADNTVWVYDDMSFSIKKINKKIGQIILQTDLGLLLPQSLLDIAYMAEHQNMLFVLAEGYGILQFDNIGNFIRRLPMEGTCFALNNDAVFFYQNKNIIRRNLYDNEQVIFYLTSAVTNLKGLAVAGSAIITLEENLLRFWKRKV
ncbi:hypothetical protein [Rhodoflexus sp.]